MVVGLLTLELRLEHSHSLKDKRQVVKSLKDRLRGKFNVSVAEIEAQELWQRAVLAVATVSADQGHAEQVMRAAEGEASGLLGPMLVRCELEWL